MSYLKKANEAAIYISLMAVFTIVLAILSWIFINCNAGITALISGAGGTLGLSIAALIRKKTALGKEVDNMDKRARNQLAAMLVVFALLTMAVFVLLLKK